MKVIEGILVGQDVNIAIIVSRFNHFITQHLLDGALDALNRHGINDDKITVVWAPGAFEIPFIAKKLAKSQKYQAVICLGAVIRGATPILTTWPPKSPRVLPPWALKPVCRWFSV